MADYLLWAERRHLEGSDRESLARTGVNFLESIETTGPFTIRRYSSHDAMLSPPRHRPPGRMPPDTSLALAAIDKLVGKMRRAKPETIRHLLERRHGNVEPTDAALMETLETLLMLVDTGPLYDPENPDQRQICSDFAFLAAFLLNPANSNRSEWRSILDTWLDIRSDTRRM